MPIKVTYQNPGLEYDENMVCEDFLNMGMLPLEFIYNVVPSPAPSYVCWFITLLTSSIYLPQVLLKLESC